jgi:hypothetical protein
MRAQVLGKAPRAPVGEPVGALRALCRLRHGFRCDRRSAANPRPLVIPDHEAALERYTTPNAAGYSSGFRTVWS